MIRDIFAVAGLLGLVWLAIQRLIPEVAEWRSAELKAWAEATRVTQRGLAIVWREHWRIYREALPR